jgi:hypothetical protein
MIFPTKSIVLSLPERRCSHLELGFQSDTFSCCQYFAVIFGSISAFQIFSGDDAIYVTYTNYGLSMMVSFRIVGQVSAVKTLFMSRYTKIVGNKCFCVKPAQTGYHVYIS